MTGQTLEDIALLEKARGKGSRLITGHTPDSAQHRNKLTIKDLGCSYGDIVLATYNLQQTALCADQVAFFCLGEMIEAGSALAVFTQPRLAQTQKYVTGQFG